MKNGPSGWLARKKLGRAGTAYRRRAIVANGDGGVLSAPMTASNWEGNWNNSGCVLQVDSLNVRSLFEPLSGREEAEAG